MLAMDQALGMDTSMNKIDPCPHGTYVKSSYMRILPSSPQSYKIHRSIKYTKTLWIYFSTVQKKKATVD